VFKLLNAGEDVLVFYNDNKASFQQFVQMMQMERNRQYQEDILLLTGDLRTVTPHTVVEDKQTSVNEDIQELTAVEGITKDKPLQQKDTMASAGSEYDDNSHGALRFVCQNIE